jgi:hypothetical protein
VFKDVPLLLKVKDASHHSSLSLESDAFISKTALVILKRHELGWKNLAQVPFDLMTLSGRFKLLKDVIDGKIFMLKDNGDQIVAYLITIGQEVSHYFPFLSSLVKDFEGQMFIKASELIITSGFDLCLGNSDIQPNTLESFVEVLIALTSKVPQLISFTLSETRSKFANISVVIFSIFEKLPIELWIPEISDIRIIEGMLKDPLESPKSKLAQLLVTKLQWEKVH